MDRFPALLCCGIAIVLCRPARAEKATSWRFWSAADGFVESYTKSIAADHSGRLWARHGIAGIISFLDGYSVKGIRDAHAHSRLFVGPRGEFWAFDGAALIRRNGSQWVSYGFPELLRLPPFQLGLGMNWVLRDRSGETTFRFNLSPMGGDRVLVLLPDRLVEWNVTGSPVVLKTAAPTRLRRFLDMQQGARGDIWLTGEGGVARLRPEARDGHLEWSEYAAPEGMREIEYPFEGDEGELFAAALAGSRRVVVRFDGKRWETVYSGHRDMVRGWRGADQDLWIQDGNTILRITNSGAERVERVEALSGMIYDILPGSAGVFWVATTEGVARYAPPLWRIPAALRDRTMDGLVNSIVEDSRGRLWFLNSNFLTSLENGAWNRFPLHGKYKLPQSRVDNVYPLPDGSVAVLESGKTYVLVFDPKRKEFERVQHPEQRRIRMFAHRRQGGLVVQSLHPRDDSLYRLETFDGRSFHTWLDSDYTRQVQDLRAVLETSTGEIWLAGANGLAVLKNGLWRRITAQEGYPDSGAFSLFELAPGHMLVGGRDMLVEFDRGRWKVLQTGLDRVRSILRSRDGNLWLASGSGVHRYSPGAWITNAAPEGLTSAVTYKMYEDRQGRIWAGTTRGLHLFHPEADLDPPRATMTPDANPRETAPDGEARLVFQGVDKWKYSASERLLFSHRIDGGSWSPFAASSGVTLQGLAAKRHHFEVRAMDRNGNVDPQPASFDFAVPRRWYYSPAFLSVAAASFSIIAALVFLAVRHYRSRGRLIVELREAHLGAEKARKAADEARQLAEAGSRSKSQFLANMSHEIRTPMNGILGLTTLTLDSALTPSQRDNLESVRECADSLLTILDDVLDFSKVEAGKLDLHPVEFSLRASLSAALKPLTVRAGWKGIQLDLQVEPEVPDALVGDAVRLRQVLLNLAGNAVKFTDQGLVAVRVALEPAGEGEVRLRFSVYDTGVGVAADKRQVIFEPFEQADGSISRRFGGSGLGLPISVKLAQMMRGRIWLESPWANRPESCGGGPGSAFHFSVPFERGGTAQPPVSKQAAPAEPLLPGVWEEARGLRILVAEDNLVNQKVVARLLEKWGHAPVLVANGREALEALAQQTFDLVLMDVHMPEMDGFEATAAIRAREAETGTHVPIVAVTAHAIKGDAERCREAGMDAYVAKPIRAADLYNTIERFRIAAAA